ncbi:VanZ family protein [Pseudomonas sp. C27(2019)]|uniref:VanZ family protein n=1 Tax=Pseudomonas sp. C27(2019) TaxID=2604941 RepID=UPI0012449471|nr:VanZ family protein [Pseudomonas sp. C27(2019)]QEY59471.1 VanZ family protein [Pseudomonas sp. C27(2019)]
MRRLFFLGCLALLLYGLFRPESPPALFSHSDKYLHVLGFGAVSLTARIAFLRAPAWLLWGVLLASAPLSEWLQQQLQNTRQFSWLDISANLLGVLLAALGWWLLMLIYSRWRKHDT